MISCKLSLKSLFLSTLVSMPALAEIMPPTFYGKINKEVRSITHDHSKTHQSSNGVVDVDNSESRIGAKGSYEVDGINFTYNLEFGFNSTNKNPTDLKSSSGRIRVRLANLKIGTDYGTFIFGQAFTASAKAGIQLDPLSNTGAGLHGIDQNLSYAHASKFVGHVYRSRKDLVGYLSPKFFNIQYKTTFDQSDDSDVTSDPDKYWENLFTFDKKYSNSALRLLLGYVSWVSVNSDDGVRLLSGFKYDYGALAFTAMYSLTESKTTAVSPVTHRDINVMASAAYNFDKNSVALTYGKKEVERGTQAEDADFENGFDSQVAIGYRRKYNKYVQLRATVAAYTVERDNKETNNNQVTSVVLGGQVSF